MSADVTRSAVRRAVDRLVHWQLRRPVVVLSIVAALTAISIGLATRLRIETGFESLLPETRPSVIELKRVSARTASQSTIFVVLEGQDPAGIRRAVDALVPPLAALGPPWVGHVESGVQDALAFLKPRTGLYTDIATLKRLRDDVEARYAYEVEKQSGLQLGLDDAPPPPIAPDRVKARGREQVPCRRPVSERRREDGSHRHPQRRPGRGLPPGGAGGDESLGGGSPGEPRVVRSGGSLGPDG